MTLLQQKPELKYILKSIKNNEVAISNALLSTVYEAIIDYAPAQRCKAFLNSIIGGTRIKFCSECGYPKLSNTMIRVFGLDNVCTTCLSEFYTQDMSGTHRHLLDYDPNVVPTRIRDLLEYNSREAGDLMFKQTEQEAKQLGKKGYGSLPYLGIELETEARSNCPGNDIVNKVRRALPNFVVCKQDGSLSNGMEIVSCPATFDVHKSGIWEPFFQENDGPAKYLRAWRTDTAGCHIHISRGAFTTMQMAKFLLFINSSENGDFIEKFAGRAGDRWAARSPKKPGDIYRGGINKHEAVNFSTSAPTLEVRMFRGNISKHGVYRNLEFMQALYSFTKVASIRGLSHVKFCDWLKESVNKKYYPYLYNWCVQNDFIRGAPIASIIEDTTRGI